VRIAAIIKPNNGCCFYRCVLPLEYMPWNMEQDSIKLFYPQGMKISEKDSQTAGVIDDLEDFNPDIIFFNRNILNRDIEWLKKQKEKGIKIVVDVDDYWELGPLHPVYNSWYKNKLNEVISDNITLADVVFVTNQQLWEKVVVLNKNCLVIPNAVPFGETYYRRLDKEHEENKMNFLYAGGSTHAPDVALLKGKFEKIGSDKFVQDNATFTLAGFNPVKGDVHCQWDRMVSTFKRTKSYQIWDTLPIEQHMTFYDRADVVLIPLVNNEFNRCKSILKVVEAATRELPCIISKVLPYTEVLGYPGILWDNWYENIRYCIKNPNFVKEEGKKLAERMKENYNLPIWSLTRYQVFKHLLNK
jgi:processive 1,2-diacylglycerol beta-glucosyltransferase